MVTIRPSVPDDLPCLLQIYTHHVLVGSASFELTPPSLEEMGRRRDHALTHRLPHLVAAADDGSIAGFAYATPFHTRPAYRFTAEDSIYLAPEAQRRGIGRALLAQVIDAGTAAGYRQMVAVVGDSTNHGSLRLHLGLGFHVVGVFRSVGWKFGRWLDTVHLQRALGPGDRDPGEPPPSG